MHVKRMKAAAPMKVELKLSSRDGGSVYVGHKVKVHAKIRSFERIDLTKITRSWTVSGSYSENSDGEMEATFSEEGTYEISVTVTNTADGSTATNSKKLRVIKSVPVTPRIAQNLKCPSTETPGQGVCGRDGFVRRPNSQIGRYIVNDTISFTANSIDPAGGTITYAWDFGDQTTDSGETVTKNYTAAGDYAAKVTASNAEGNSSSNSIRIKVEEMSAAGNAEKPSAPVITGPTSAAPNTELTFSATTKEHNCDGKVDNLFFMWNMGDRSRVKQYRASDQVKHTYTSAGGYAIEVKAYCPATKLSSEKTNHRIAIQSMSPSTPVISGPSSGNVGEQIMFTAKTATKNCPEHLKYQYDYGDGNSKLSDTDGVTHIYQRAGDFTVKLFSQCPSTRERSDIATHSIKISQGAGGGGGGGGGGSASCNVPNPSRDYSIEQYPTVSFYGNPVTFGTKAGGSSYEWDFGDGSTKSTSRKSEAHLCKWWRLLCEA